MAVPWKITLVPVLRPVKSRVVPAGTTTLSKMIVEQVVFEAIAVAAVLNVQPARLSRSAGAYKMNY